MMDHYILIDDEPVKVGILQWAAWMVKADPLDLRRVERTVVSDHISVSTVFLGLDHGFDSPRPVLWESMTFGGLHSELQWRYTSRTDAIEGHERMVRIARGEILCPDEGCGCRSSSS